MKFNLTKEVEKTKFVLAKRQININVRAQVAMNLDVSGSTQDLYKAGTMQKAFQQVLPVGIVFDDNQEIDVFTFCNGARIQHIQPNATITNYEKYVSKMLDQGGSNLWGGTDYAPVIIENLREFGFYKKVESGGFLGMGRKKEVKLTKDSTSGYPVLVYMLTDGENSDKDETRKILKECQDLGVNIYFMFVGVGSNSFSFLNQIADDYSNVGFLAVTDLDKFTDREDAYEWLLPEEMCKWLRNKN